MAEKQLRHTAAQIDSAVDKANSALQAHQKLKTINGESIVGEGNIAIKGGGGGLTQEQEEALGQLSELSLKVGEIEASKQDTISDLETIRSGAAAGATAYTKPADGIPSSDLSSDLQTSIGRADTIYDDYINSQELM